MLSWQHSYPASLRLEEPNESPRRHVAMDHAALLPNAGPVQTSKAPGGWCWCAASPAPEPNQSDPGLRWGSVDADWKLMKEFVREEKTGEGGAKEGRNVCVCVWRFLPPSHINHSKVGLSDKEKSARLDHTLTAAAKKLWHYPRLSQVLVVCEPLCRVFQHHAHGEQHWEVSLPLNAMQTASSTGRRRAALGGESASQRHADGEQHWEVSLPLNAMQTASSTGR
ncbi:unnamed protein product [Boreogadus saida]